MSPLKPILKKIGLIGAGLLGAAVLVIVLWLDRPPAVDATLPEQLQQEVAKITGKPVVFPPAVPEIDLPELERLLKSKKVLLLDARPDFYYQRSHIPGALSLSPSSFREGYANVKEAFQRHAGDPTVVYCADRQCPNAGYVARALIALGYDDVFLFPEGITAWK